MYGLSGNIEAVQRNLGVPSSGTWDALTSGALPSYQQVGRGALPMFPTGQPDPATLINLGYYDPLQDMPMRQRVYLEGGERPGTFWRDLGVAGSQVPQWAWLAIGALALGLAYWSHRKDRPKRRA